MIRFIFQNIQLKKFDTIICFYVLNVLLPEEQARSFNERFKSLKPNGKYILLYAEIFNMKDLEFIKFTKRNLSMFNKISIFIDL
jgi:predicted nucleotidyltransferase